MRLSFFATLAVALLLGLYSPSANAENLSLLNADGSNFESVVTEMAKTTSVVDIAGQIVDAGLDITLEQIAFLVSLDIASAVEIVNIFLDTIPAEQQEAFLNELVAVIIANVQGIDQNEAFAALSNTAVIAFLTPVTFGLDSIDGSCAR